HSRFQLFTVAIGKMDRALALHAVENFIRRMLVHRAFLARLAVDMHPDVIVLGREQSAFGAVTRERRLVLDVDEQRLHHFPRKRRHVDSSAYCSRRVTRSLTAGW